MKGLHLLKQPIVVSYLNVCLYPLQNISLLIYCPNYSLGWVLMLLKVSLYLKMVGIRNKLLWPFIFQQNQYNFGPFTMFHWRKCFAKLATSVELKTCQPLTKILKERHWQLFLIISIVEWKVSWCSNKSLRENQISE